MSTPDVTARHPLLRESQGGSYFTKSSTTMKPSGAPRRNRYERFQRRSENQVDQRGIRRLVLCHNIAAEDLSGKNLAVFDGVLRSGAPI
jgi:hypothetical protein